MVKDIKGLEFRVGCVFGMSCGKDQREVLKVCEDGVMTMITTDKNQACFWPNTLLVHNNATILHYRELAPDKFGKMLREGDTVEGWSGEQGVIGGQLGGYFYILLKEYYWQAKEITFVSRPTDIDPNQTEILARLKAMEDAHTKEGEEIAKLKKEMGV